ncbi:hydrogenase maturation protease [Fulvivirga sedimenti]|uniref:Hydrogenase maturation protease n=1 Tax=Fulvivirga sedimenti TaxID=2879465 RepID=A0A9X1HWM1_9BACT|nr:hydrogenase maturation protease [Fulvivirga sedimenti]MCA6079191.1 hydrogenase maturation protease [Fulvivirga sedimenti]
MEVKDKILVLGIGNLLLGDEGVGVQAVQYMEKLDLPPDIDVLDGGTGGFHLLEIIQSYPTVIIIDATIDGQPAGAISILEPYFASDYPPSLSAHDVGLKDLIGSLYLLGKVPKVYLLTVSIEGIQPMTMNLSEPVQNNLEKIAEVARELVSVIRHHQPADA